MISEGWDIPTGAVKAAFTGDTDKATVAIEDDAVTLELHVPWVDLCLDANDALRVVRMAQQGRVSSEDRDAVFDKFLDDPQPESKEATLLRMLNAAVSGTESLYTDDLGAELAYLCKAILEDDYVTWDDAGDSSPTTQARRLFEDIFEDDGDPIWKYIRHTS